MKKKLASLLYTLIIIVTFCSCDPWGVPWGAERFYKFIIKNNGDNLIYYQVSKSYPDISIPDSLTARISGIASSKSQSEESKDKWPKYFSRLPADTLSIFFFSPDTVKKYGWKQVQSKHLILKRKDISLQDLEDNNYVVSYP